MSKTPTQHILSLKNILASIPRKWLVVWLLIYFSFLALDIIIPDSPGSSLIKYAGIFLCLTFAYKKYKADNLLIMALLMTFLADTILIWTDQFVFGIFVFTFAHFFHLSRFTKTAPHFLPFYYLIIVSIFALALIRNVPPIYAIAFVYAISLITNVILSIRWYLSDRQNVHALAGALGFIAFALCDINVGIQFLASEAIFASWLYPIATYLVWLFYYPSQILIANSSTLSSKILNPRTDKAKETHQLKP